MLNNLSGASLQAKRGPLEMRSYGVVIIVV
jgi:hypothetical protein